MNKLTFIFFLLITLIQYPLWFADGGLRTIIQKNAQINAQREINTALKKLFSEAGMILVDYKLEFGDSSGELLLGDEFTPDGCRVWDVETREKLDKDRFRQGLGDVVESYQIMARRLGVI